MPRIGPPENFIMVLFHGEQTCSKCWRRGVVTAGAATTMALLCEGCRGSGSVWAR